MRRLRTKQHRYSKRILSSNNIDESDIEKYIDISCNRVGQDVRYALDDSKLKALGWEPQAEFDKELKGIVEYYKNKFIW